MKKLALFCLALMVGIFTFVGARWAAAGPLPESDPEEPPPARNIYNVLPLPEAPEALKVLVPQPELPQALELFPWSAVVYEKYVNGYWDIYFSTGDYGNETPLTTTGAIDIYPRLNRGSDQVVFSSDSSGSFNLFRMDLDGSNLVQLTTTGKDNVNASWSVDASRIAFESYRDNDQAEIYVMNRDGSAQTRLTFDADYDGMPFWSPDGTKIAFVSRRTGGYRVYTMNADGTGLTQLSTQPYSAYPTWSPDGSLITYAADADYNGFWELWLMNADGSNQHLLLSTTLTIDYTPRSWTPEGDKIAFTTTSWINSGGNWYWTTSVLAVRDIATGTNSAFGTGNTNFNPDWQNTESASPVSSVHSLPGTSPYMFFVNWSGQDVGPSGLKNFDVQVKDGSDGNWTTWLNDTILTTATYNGIGGHTYYFRSRAEDNAYNLEDWPENPDAATTVESNPPVSSFQNPSSFLRNGSEISWSAYDPGGSGILSYEIQYRNSGGGGWTPWQSNTMETLAYFSGTLGATYDFRVRATDKAQNVEPWPADQDAQFTVYSWGISGSAYDNVGIPVSDFQLTTDPNPLASLYGPEEGAYAAYVVPTSNLYAAAWTKTGYADLPETSFKNDQDAKIDIVLPPADNVVADWGFESGSLEPNWTQGGNLPSVITQTFHTGQYGPRMGPSFPFLEPDVLISENLTGTISYSPAIAVGPDQTVHLVWADNSSIKYTRRDSDGHWSGVVETFPIISDSVQIKVDGNRVLHMIWLTSGEIYYRQRDANGIWTSPKNISNSTFYSSPQLIVDHTNVPHVFWVEAFESYKYIIHSQRLYDGTWLSPERINVPGTIASESPSTSYGKLAVFEKNGTLYVIDNSTTSPDYTFNYIFGTSGNWSEPEPLFVPSNDSNVLKMIVSPTGTVHVIWDGEHTYYPCRSCAWYAFHNSDGWSTPQPISPQGGLGPIYKMDFFLRKDGSLTAFWTSQSNLYFAQKPKNEAWAPVQTVPNASIVGTFRAMMDSAENIHLVYTSASLYHTQQDIHGNWSTPQYAGTPTDSVFGVQLALDQNGHPHIAWDKWNTLIYYSGPPTVAESGETSLSQAVTIPFSMTAPTLSFLYDLDGPTALGGSFDVQVDDGQNQTTVFSTSSGTNSWQHVWVDMSPWAGQTVTLTLILHQIEGYYAFVNYVDEITLGAAHPDLWVQARALSPAAVPGDEIVFALTYGNRGGAPAESAHLTATLPAAFEFVSANLPPTSTASALVWDLGTLPARSEPATILLTLRVTPSAPLGADAALPLTIHTPSSELETLNNTAAPSAYIGRRIYLPTLVR